MLHWIKYKWALLRLDLDEKKLQIAFGKEAKKTKTNNTEIGFEERRDYVRQLMDLTRKRTYESTDYLLRLAEKLDIPTDDVEFHDDDYIHNNLRLLNTNGRHALRKEIRAEQARRRQPLYLLITAVTGLLGAATGFVAILMK